MKKSISIILVAVILCLGLSACGEEPNLKFASPRTSREEYNWFVENKVSIYATLTVVNGEIPTAEKVPVNWAFPVKLFLGIRKGSAKQKDPLFSIYADGFKIDTSLGEAQENQYEHTFYRNNESYSALYVTSDDILDNNIVYPVDMYLTYLSDEIRSGDITLRLMTDDGKGSKQASFYYATDGEYIAYSVESISAAKKALKN